MIYLDSFLTWEWSTFSHY